MIPYVISTFLSCFFIRLGTRDRMKNKRINIWIVFAIVIPSVLAGARDITVGTDTSIYGVPFFTYALQRSFESYMVTAGGDPLWLLLVYGLSRITTEVFWELFLIEFVIMFFTYKGLKQYDLGRYTWIGFLVFHLMFYSFTLNLMRQFVCLSIVFYSFRFVKEHRWKTYFLICLILMLIHKTAVIAILLYPMYHLTTGTYEDRFMSKVRLPFKEYLFKMLVIMSACITVMFASKAIVYISNLLGTFTSQVDYLTGSYNIVWRNPIYMLPLLAVALLYEKQVTKYNGDFSFFTLMLIVYIILWQLQGISRELYRVGFYFGYFLIVGIPLLIKNVRGRENRMILFSMIFILMVSFYVDYFVMHLYNETYPYTSQMLGIG